MKELEKYKELMNLYKENREVLNTKCDGLKVCNYLFDIKNNIVGLIEDNKIEELQDFLKDKYSNKVEEELNYQLQLLNDKIKVTNDLFKSVL